MLGLLRGAGAPPAVSSGDPWGGAGRVSWGAPLLWAGLLGCCPLVGGVCRGAALLWAGLLEVLPSCRAELLGAPASALSLLAPGLSHLLT